ncbi:MAG: ABC transporter permease [Thermotoga sp.]|nr:MAG: ABC transporter permease [Thermotoga sp.]HDM70162.1 ABC transporter permease subunit [Thermotogales bacterium]
MNRNLILSRKWRKYVSGTLFYIVVLGIALIILIPIYFLFTISLMSDQEAYDWPIRFFPSFVNEFVLQEASTPDKGYLLSVYSHSKGIYVPLCESKDLDTIVKKAKLKTNSSIPKELLKRKIDELKDIMEKNKEDIERLRSKMTPYLEKLERLNGRISRILSEVNKYNKKLKLAERAGMKDAVQAILQKLKSLNEELGELKEEAKKVSEKITLLNQDLIPITSVKFTISKNIFENYITFFKVTNDSIPALIRSIQVALLTIAISLSIGGLAGYAFARYYFRGKNLLKLSVLFVRMFPGVSIAMPMVIILAKMGFYDKPLGLSLVYSVGQIGMTTWITASIFMGIPVELEEAAQIFGCSKWGAFFHVTLPLALPGLAASAMYAFIGSWSETAQAIILTQFNPTFPVVVYQTLVGAKGLVNLVAAGGVTMALPAIIFTLIIRRYILQMWGGVTV